MKVRVLLLTAIIGMTLLGACSDDSGSDSSATTAGNAAGANTTSGSGGGAATGDGRAWSRPTWRSTPES